MGNIYKLDEDEQRQAVNLAMRIEIGEIHPEHVIQVFKSQPLAAEAIVLFWSTFNDMTKHVLEMIVCHKCKEHLESCLRHDAKGFSKMEL